VASAPTERLPVTEAPPAGRRILAGHARRAHGAHGAHDANGARSGSRPALWWPTLLLAGGLCFVTFFAKGGLNLESMTSTEMALTLLAGALVAVAVLRERGAGGRSGFWAIGLLLALSALTALSVAWSVQPTASWQDSGRMLAYSGVFGAAVALVRLAPERWPAVLGGLTLAAVAVCAYALLTKVFPASLAASNHYARLEEPYGYWNAIGLTAAMGVIGCMWLGARRGGHALLSALAYPAMGVLLLTLVLAYSRGALAALAAGLVLWFCAVPLRLRGAAVLILGCAAAAGVAAWDFSMHALSSDNVALAERTAAGHRFGAILLAMVVALALAGIAVGFVTGRRAPALISRRRAGVLLLGLAAAALIAFAGALAHSHRGFAGSISHAVDALTNPNAKTPPNTPGRLTAVASVRARYWKEGFEVWEAHPALGAGAMGYQTARLRYRKAPLVVAHAHGFVVQTLADLGLVGMALALALLAAWMAAAGRATHPFNRSWAPWRSWRALARRSGPGASVPGPGWRAVREPYTAERIALLSMLCLVVVFGVHSLVDWTWYIPGDACVALICAGWLAGRGPLAARTGARPARPRPLPRSLAELGRGRALLAAVVLAAALLAAWSQWQPQRSEAARQQALAQLARDPSRALASAKLAVSRDPLSAIALETLAEVQRVSGQPASASATLAQAVREQPSNPRTWLALGRYDLATNPRAALPEMRAAIYLDPESIAPELITGPRAEREAITIYNQYIQALRAAIAPPPVRSVSAPPRRAAGGARRGARRRSAPRSARSRSSQAAG
jgi:hypothetical protein